MPIATGVAKHLRYKVESSWGVAPGATGAQVLRRVTSELNLAKETYESAEISTHHQRVDYRHGTRSVQGAIRGELSPGTYKDFTAAILARAYSTINAITGLSITIAGSGPTWTVTRSAGSWLTDGIKAGHVVRLTAGSFNAANLNKNLLVLSLTATVLTVMPLNGVALFAEGPISSATLSVPGRVTYAPMSGHTDLSYAIEHWHSDVSLSELFLGCKVRSMQISMPASGMATVAFDFLGRDVQTAASAYYTSPTAETTTGILAAANGLLLYGGSSVANVTSLELNVQRAMDASPAVGSQVYADIAEGRILAEGRLTALFENATLRDWFINEAEASLVVAMSANNSAAADFITLTLPRVKATGADKDDGDKAIVQTVPFVAMLNVAGGSGQSSEQTTIMVQDSQA